MKKFTKHQRMTRMVFCAIMIALITVMTFVPNIGYIAIGVIELTTIQIVVALGACLLGPGYGTILGAAWGITCLIRAFTNPAWIMFTNPLISVLPRVLVGLCAAGTFLLFKKLFKLPNFVAALASGAAASITNTAFVLTSIYIFGEMTNFYGSAYELIKGILSTILALNGGLELVASAVLVPLLFTAVSKQAKKYGISQ